MSDVRAYTPEWVYIETGIRPEIIRETAREMAEPRTGNRDSPGPTRDLVR